jgi:hypothetical protein
MLQQVMIMMLACLLKPHCAQQQMDLLLITRQLRVKAAQPAAGRAALAT